MKKHIISLLVNNEPGVLIRIALVFARRAYNIDSLVTHPTHNTCFSIINITATGEEQVLSHIIKQLNKITDVIRVIDTSDIPAVKLELSMMKIRFPEENRTNILTVLYSLKCTVVSMDPESLIVRYVGNESELNAIEEILEPYGIIEIIRTGTVLMARGSRTTV